MAWLARLLAFVPGRGFGLLAVGLMVVGLVVGAYGYGYGSGKAAAMAKAAREVQQARAELAQYKLDQQTKLNEVNAQVRLMEVTYAQEVTDLRAQYTRENASAQANDARTIADLRAGLKRLRVQIANSGSGAAGRPEAPATPAGADGSRTAELAPETAAALWAIAADGDAAIRQLTGLQAWALSAQKLCSGGPTMINKGKTGGAQ